jgi:hypothetical protein
MYRWQWIPLICLVAAFLATLAVLVLWRRRTLRGAERHPVLRDPGESQRDLIAAAAWNTAEYAALCVFLPPLLFCVYPLKSVYDGNLPELEMLAVFSLAAAGLLALPLARLWRSLSDGRRLALGYEATVAAKQELIALRHLDYYIFHDVPVEELGSHIDHVVVGPAGVFVVSVMGRMAPGSNSASGEPTEVTYDGERLQFPGWEETLPLGQVVTQADWLCGWLANALNEPIGVRAILVLPGWSVKRTAVSGIPVLAARRVSAYFSRMRPLPEMTDTMVERVSEQLDGLCRIVALVPPVEQPQPQEPPPPPQQPEEQAATVH